MISAEERKTRASFKMAIFFTAIAIFWTVYIWELKQASSERQACFFRGERTVQALTAR